MPFLLPSHPPVSLHKPVLLFCWLAWDSARPSSPCPATSLGWSGSVTHPCSHIPGLCYRKVSVKLSGCIIVWIRQLLVKCLNSEHCFSATLSHFCVPFSCWLSALGSYRFGILSGLVLDLPGLSISRVCSILLWLAHLLLSSSVWFCRWIFVLAKRSVIEIWLPLGQDKQLFNWHAVYLSPPLSLPHSGVYLWVTLRVLSFPLSQWRGI